VKRFVIGIVAAITILPIGCMSYFAPGFSQTRADAKPSALESAILRSRFALRSAEVLRKSPIRRPQTTTALVAGGKLYVAGCQGCHGEWSGPYQEIMACIPYRLSCCILVRNTRSPNSTDRETWHSNDGNVRVRSVLFGKAIVGTGSVSAPNQQIASGHDRKHPPEKKLANA